MSRPICAALGPLCLLSALAIAEPVRAQGQTELQLPPPEPAEAGKWRLGWPTIAGEDYVLQRSEDLRNWIDVVTLTADSTSASWVDEEAPEVDLLMWRLMGPDGSVQEPVTISNISPSLGSAGTGDATTLGVIIRSNEPVRSVVFFNGEEPLGSAKAGLGGSWLFRVDRDRRRPRVVQLSVEVTTASGLTVRTPTRGFLVADPSKFIALQPSPRLARAVTDGLAPELEGLIEASASGELGPFLYYPEGLGDPVRTTGAHFAFAAGATLAEVGDDVLISFSEADFHRGHTDEAPLPALPGPHEMPIDAILPETVAAHFDAGAGGKVELRWGPVAVAWDAGTLSDAGWAALDITPLGLDDFILPGGRLKARVSGDPATGTFYLNVCFFGEWSPLPESEMRFRIPRADPLKLYLATNGQLSGHGTVEAEFPDGATLRGSVSWRAPNFEVRLEGRGFTIPALGLLEEHIPATPLAVSPSGTSEAELDAATEALLAYRNIYKNLAVSGLRQTATDDTTLYAPPAVPTDSAGSVLEGWAWRLRSWARDRAGESLPTNALAELSETIKGAGATAEAAQDLPTVLELLRDLLVLKSHREDALGGENAEFDALVSATENRLFAAADRLANERPGFASTPEFSATIALLKEIDALAAAEDETAEDGIAEAGDGMDAATRTRIYAGKIGRKFLFGLEVEGRRTALADLDPAGILRFLEILLELETLGRTSGGLPPDQQALVDAAQVDARNAFAERQNALVETAIADGNYHVLRQLLNDRGRFFMLHAELDPEAPLSSNDDLFFPRTLSLADAFKSARAKLTLGDRLKHCGDDWRIVNRIADATTDRGADSGLYADTIDIHSCNDLLSAQSGADQRCNELALALASAGFPQPAFGNGNEGSFFQDISGRYESVPEPPPVVLPTFYTMQINQGGRYITGAVQRQQSSIQTRYELEGMLIHQQTEGVISSTFAYRLTDAEEPDDPPLEFGLLTVEEEGESATAILQSENFGMLEFYLASKKPVFSDSIIAAFDAEFQQAVGTAHKRPMHSIHISNLIARLNALKAPIAAWYASSAVDEDSRALAVDLAMGQFLNFVSDEQLPLARVLASQTLSRQPYLEVPKSKIGGVTFGGGNVTRAYWDALATLFLVTPVSMPNTQKLLGIAQTSAEATEDYVTPDAYQYDIHMKSRAKSGLVLAEADLDVTITKKLLPDGPVSTFTYYGVIGGLTLGKGGPAGLIVSEINGSVVVPFSWNEEDFEGEVGMHQVGVNFVLPEGGVSFVVLGAFEIIGSGRFPPIKFELETGSAAGLAIGAGVDLLEGAFTSTGAGPPPEGSLLFDTGINFNVEADTNFADAVYFETNSAVLSDCAWQALREFVAEHRALFESPDLHVGITGFTDTVGTDALNNALSMQRAESVKQALFQIIGTDLRIPIDDFSLTALGEVPARDACGGCDGVNDPLFRRTDIAINGVVQTIIRNATLAD